MIKRTIITALIVFTSLTLYSQTRDVNITISPYGEHIWWNKNTTLDNSFFWGARAGFSFGPLFEIRGFYQRSSDVKASLRPLDWNISENWASNMMRTNMDIERYGGEVKLNLMNKPFFAPYITLGGGIQNMKYNMPYKEFPELSYEMMDEKIFGTIGIGTKFNLSNRIVLSLEAKNTFFNVSEESYYLNSDYNFADRSKNRLGNWSAMASLDFYLGGVNSKGDEVHNAYEKLFSDGFAGMKFVIEPGLTYIKLKDESLFDEQYFLGASAGVDLSSLVGIRGFYYQATETPDKPSFKFNDKLSMYGANIIARLSQPRGINPYLVLGGGYIKTGSNYINTLGEIGKQSRGFAMGGVGIEIPLSKYIALYGNVNALLTNEGEGDLSTIETASHVKTSVMYQTGLRVNIGKSASINYDDINNLSPSAKEYNNQQVNELRITPEELSIIVREAVRETRSEYATPIQSKEIEVDTTNHAPKTISIEQPSPTTIEVKSNNDNSNLDKQLDDLNKAIATQSAVIADLRNDAAQLQLESSKTSKQLAKSNKKGNTPFMRLSKISPIASMDFGTQFFWNLGARGHWQIKKSNFEIMPEVNITFGKSTRVGVSANLVYNFGKDTSLFNPYVGFGYGTFPGKKTIWGTNAIVGTSYKTGLGIVFMDYSIRSTFKQNQIAIGYRFAF